MKLNNLTLFRTFFPPPQHFANLSIFYVENDFALKLRGHQQSLCLSLTVTVSKSQSLSLSLSVSVSQSQSFSLSLSVSVTQSQSLSLSLSVSVSQSQSLSLSLSV